MALVVASSGSFNNVPVSAEAVAQDAGLAKLKSEVQEKLVAAARRKAMANIHRAQAAKLAETVRGEKHAAALFQKRSEVSEEEAEVKHADVSVKAARGKVDSDEKRASALGVAANQDKERALADKESAMEFSDTEGALMQQASSDQDKIRAVMAKEKRTALALPVLGQAAKVDETRAALLMAHARSRMAESKLKAAAALRLDAIVVQKEGEARVARAKLMAVLDEKSAALDSKLDGKSAAVDSKAGVAEQERERAGKEAVHAAAAHAARASNLERAGRASERRGRGGAERGEEGRHAGLRVEKPARMMYTLSLSHETITP